MRRMMIATALAMVFLATGVCGMLDPSAVYCEGMGYTFTLVDSPEGAHGVCQMPDSTDVNAWDFLKGKAGKEHSYCEREGYVMKTVTDPDKCSRIFSDECAVCVKDGQETEVTVLMNLSFKEAVCGDGLCVSVENYRGCPEDCPSGLLDGYCDGIEDGECDPDCTTAEDADCTEDDPDAGCVDDDGICQCECVGQDNDCEYENGTAVLCEGEPESELQPEPVIACVYDGMCYPECAGTDDIDCLCLEPESDECRNAMLQLRVTGKAAMLQRVPPPTSPMPVELIVVIAILAVCTFVFSFTRFRKGGPQF